MNELVIITLNGRDKRRQFGMTHEIVGILADGGPGVIACTGSLEDAQAIVHALELVARI